MKLRFLTSCKPRACKLIKFIWSFKRKRPPIRFFIKYKARLCVHGGMQEKGVDYFNIFPLVMNQNTVCFLLTQSIMNGQYTHHVNYVLAFSQAECDTGVYSSLPPGFYIKNKTEGQDYCINLKKTHIELVKRPPISLLCLEMVF